MLGFIKYPDLVQIGWRGEEPLGQQGAAWNFFPGEVGDLRDRPPLLQQRLAAGNIVKVSACHRPPCLVALREEAYPSQRQARFAVEPRVVDHDVIDEAVDAKGEIVVTQRLDRGGRFVPAQAQLREGFGL